MLLLDEIIEESEDKYYNPFFMMHPQNVIGYKKKRYMGFLVKYHKMVDKEIVLFGDINYA